MKKILAILMVLALTLVLGAGLAEEEYNFTVGVSIAGFSAPYFVAMTATMEEVAKDYPGLELKFLDAEWDIQKQASQVESLIEQKCDLIELVPCDSTAIIPTMQKVADAGIPLFIVNTQHDPSSEDLIVTFIGASMEDEASMCAQSMMDTFGDEECNLVIIEGASGSFPAIHRTEGFMAAIEGHDNFHVLGQQLCEWDRPTAQATMEDFITRYGDELNAVFSHDDNMAIGVIQALKAAGIADQVKVFSISGTREGVDAIIAGDLVSSIDQSPELEGRNAVEYAVRYLKGEQIDKWVKTPIAAITAENAAEFDPAW